jgi:hypothetical protein
MSPVRKLCLGLLIVIVAGAAFLAYSMERAGPHLTAELRGDRWHIEGRFLSEYSLGFERVKIVDAETSGVICEFAGDTNADIDLVQGINTPAMMFGGDTKLISTQSSRTCELKSGQVYEVTAWGNNGFGKIRPSSIQVRI